MQVSTLHGHCVDQLLCLTGGQQVLAGGGMSLDATSCGVLH